MERVTPSNAGEWALLIEQAKAEDFRRGNADLFENDGELDPEIYRSALGGRSPVLHYETMNAKGKVGSVDAGRESSNEGETIASGLDVAQFIGFHALWADAPKQERPDPALERANVALSSLDPKDQELVWQRYVMGMTLEAMAEEHGYASRQAMDYHVKQARKRLADAFLAQTKDRSKRDG